MNDKNRTMLEDLIADQIFYIGKFNPDDEGYGAMINSLKTTCSISLEERKLANDSKEKKKARSIEHQYNNLKLELDKKKIDTESETKLNEYRLNLLQADGKSKDRIAKVVLDCAGIMVPIIFYGIWMKRGFKFEETGVFTSKTFSGLINRFKPTK